MRFLWQPRLPLYGPAGLSIGHLLVVAGPSASGKSTFLAALASRTLPAEILATFPPGAPDWPHTNGRRVQRGRLRRRTDKGGTMDGVVLHYDILRPFETTIGDYSADPALTILRAAERVTIVALVAPAEQLAARLAARPPKRRFFDPVTLRLRTLFGRRRSAVYDKAAERARHAKLVRLYEEPDFLASWWRRWEDFLRAELADRPQAVLSIEPVATSSGAPAYRLIRGPGESPPA